MVLSLLLACSCALVASGPNPCDRVEVRAIIKTEDKMPEDVRAKMMDELACDCEELKRKYEECPGVARVAVSVEMPADTKCPCNKPKTKDGVVTDETDKCGCNKPKPKGEEVKACSSCNKPCGSCNCGCKSGEVKACSSCNKPCNSCSCGCKSEDVKKEEITRRKCSKCCKQKCGCKPKCSTCCTGCNSACNSCCKTCCH